MQSQSKKRYLLARVVGEGGEDGRQKEVGVQPEEPDDPVNNWLEVKPVK